MLNIKCRIATIGLIILCHSYLFAQNKFDRGLKAFDAKDYKTSFDLLKPYAENGNCLAEFVIGFSYQYGLYVTANDSLARHWLQLSADQKQPNAMGPLAANLMMNSKKSPDDIVFAYLWAMLAVEYSPSQMMTSTRYVIKGYLQPDQLEKANKLIEEYKQKWKDKEDCH